MSKKIKIRINEKQPLPCTTCDGIFGYQYYDKLQVYYTSIHDEDGKYSHGEYTDDKPLGKGRVAYCANCGEVLPFRLIRENEESV